MSAEGLSISLQQQHGFRLSASLTCQQSQILAVVGPSGSGKSTLLRIISGLTRDVDGQIRCNGKVWQDSNRGIFLTPQQRRVGMVFQNYALFPHLNAFENVIEGACTLPLKDQRSAAKSWLERVHMDGLEFRYPHQLSGGQQQRVALARAMVGTPNLLLLDEPFAAVDKVTREKLYQELATLRHSLNLPTILVTHDVDEALMLADQLCILAQGKIMQCAKPTDVVTKPISGHVARLTGHRNIFRAQVISHDLNSKQTLIEWRGKRLVCELNTQFSPGCQVSWVISSSHVLLLDPDSETKPENSIMGRIQTLISLGEMMRITVSIKGNHLPPLHLNLPVHTISRNKIVVGKEACISLQPEGIRLMHNDKYQISYKLNSISV